MRGALLSTREGSRQPQGVLVWGPVRGAKGSFSLLLLLAALVSLWGCSKSASSSRTELASGGDGGLGVDTEVLEKTLAPVDFPVLEEARAGRLELFVSQLSNGMTVVLVEEHSAPVVAVQLWARGGSAQDAAGASGSAHLLEHLFFRSSQGLADGEYDKLMERYGIDPSATTWFEYTFYYLKAPSRVLDEVIALEATRWAGPTFDDAVVASEREVLLRERSYRVDNNPEGILLERLWQLAMPEHPYHNSSVGQREQVQTLQVEHLRAFWQAHYRPSQSAVVLVGDFHRADALAMLQRHFGALPEEGGTPASPPAALPCEPLPQSARRETVSMPIDAELLLLGYPAPAAGTRESAAMRLLNEALFAQPFGLLYRELKLENEWLAELEGWVGDFSCRSLWEIKLTTRHGVSHREPRRVILTTLAQTAQTGLSAPLLERARRRLELDWALQAADVASLAEGLGHAWVTTGKASSFFDFPQQMESISNDEIASLAKHWLGASRLTELLGVPPDE